VNTKDVCRKKTSVKKGLRPPLGKLGLIIKEYGRKKTSVKKGLRPHKFFGALPSLRRKKTSVKKGLRPFSYFFPFIPAIM